MRRSNPIVKPSGATIVGGPFADEQPPVGRQDVVWKRFVAEADRPQSARQNSGGVGCAKVDTNDGHIAEYTNPSDWDLDLSQLIPLAFDLRSYPQRGSGRG
jgi:hypothetical protein